MGCVRERVCTPSKVVLSRQLQQSYTPPGSSVAAYGARSCTKKSNDSFVGQRQSFVVVQHAYDTNTPPPFILVRERVEVEHERVRRGRLRGFPPQLAHQGEVEAGFDALYVREDQGRDVQAGIEDRTEFGGRIERTLAASELHGRRVGAEVSRSLLARRCFFSLFVRSHRSEKVVFCFGNRALGTHRHNSSRVDRDMSHALASPSLFRLSARAVVPKRARTRRFAARAGGHPAPIGFPHPPPTIHVMKISPPEPDHK